MNEQTSVNDAHASDEHQTARQRLCYALSRDLADSVLSDSHGAARLAEMFSTGFQGFSTVSDLELIVAIFEAGLEDNNIADVETLYKYVAV